MQSFARLKRQAVRTFAGKLAEHADLVVQHVVGRVVEPGMDAAERFAVRAQAVKDGVWPPRGGQPGQTLIQENMLVVPASFSPLH